MSVVFYNHRGPEHVFGGDDDEASFHVSGFVLNRKKICLLYEHFNDHLIISCNHYFDGIIQPDPFWDFPLLLNLSQSNLPEPFGNMVIIAFIQHKYANSLTNTLINSYWMHWFINRVNWMALFGCRELINIVLKIKRHLKLVNASYLFTHISYLEKTYTTTAQEPSI